MPKELSIEQAFGSAAAAPKELSVEEAFGTKAAGSSLGMAPKLGAAISGAVQALAQPQAALDKALAPNTVLPWNAERKQRTNEAVQEFGEAQQLFSHAGVGSDNAAAAPDTTLMGLLGMAGSGLKYLGAPISAIAQAGPGRSLEHVTKGQVRPGAIGDISDMMLGLVPFGPKGETKPVIPEDIAYRPYPQAKPKKGAAAPEKPPEAPAPSVEPQPPAPPQEAPTATPGVRTPRVRRPVVLGDELTIEEAMETGPHPTDELDASRMHPHSGQIPFRAVDVAKDAEGTPLDIEPLHKGTFEIAQDLNRMLGLTHRQGRITKRSAVGQYDRRDSVVRTRAMHEIQVLSHEGGHAFEFQKPPYLEPLLKAHEPELVQMYDKHYGGSAPGAERQEGFAEFFRLYVEHPELAQKDAPNFYQAFEDTLKQHNPELLEKLQGAQANYRAILQAPSAAVAMSEIASAEKPGAISSLISRAKDVGVKAFVKGYADEAFMGIFDRYNPINVATKKLQAIAEERGKAPISLETHEHPYRLFRMAAGARNAGHMDIAHGVHPYHSINPEGSSLADGISYALATAEDIAKATAEGKNELPVGSWSPQRYKEFSTYLSSRNMLAQWRRYQRRDQMGGRELPPSRHPPVVYQQAIKTFEAANPHWQEAGRMVHNWAENLWRLRYDAGLITQQEYEMGLLKHPDYVPAFRDMRDPGDEIGGSTAGISTPIRGSGDMGKGAGGVKQMKGSTRNIIDPLWSLAQQAYELRMLIARNDAVGALVKLAKEVGPGSGAILEKVPAKQIKATEISLQEALDAARKNVRGLSERDEIELEQAVETVQDIMGDNAKGTIYRATDASEAGDPVVYHWANGVKSMHQLPDGRLGQMMVDSISNMNRPSRDLWVNILSQPARALRFFVTVHPKFLFSNIMRDQIVNAGLNEGYIPFVDWGKGVFHEVRGALRKDEASRRYNAAQGAIGGMQTAAERLVNARKSIKAMIDRGFDIKELPEKVAAFTELSETGGRLGTFMRVEKQAQKRGLDDWEAAMHGSWEARDILDFDLHGSWKLVQDFARMVPFANANLQGSSKIAKTLFSEQLFKWMSGEAPRTPQEAAAMRKAVWAWQVVGGMAAATGAQRAYYANDPRFQEVNQTLRATHWVFLDPNHPERIYAYPKPYEMAAMSALAERSYEGAVLHDPKALQHGWEDFFNLALPNLSSPPILETPFAMAGNRDYFKMPIVQEDQKDLSPKFQESEYTSEVAKAFPFVGGSPAKTDYFMKQFGYVPQDILKGIDRAVKKGPEVEDSPADWFTMGRWVRDLTRGSEASKAFWELVGKNEQHAEDLHTLIMKRDEPKRAYEELMNMTPSERGWAMVNTFGRQQEKDVHPMNYVRNQFLQNSRLYRDISSQEITDKPGGDVIPLDPHKRREAIDALRFLSLVQLHNALKTAHEPGFSHQEFMDPEEPMQRLRAVDPRLAEALKKRYETGHVAFSPQQAAKNWASIRERYEQLPSEENFLGAAKGRLKSGAGAAARALRADPTQE